jgi:hypothetical protein
MMFKEGCINISLEYGGYSGPKGNNPSVSEQSDFF